ncbi:glycerophosphodiester phosphodiesterase [Aromatoleum aromaticum]|uniref:Glycerophosphoryl diester phosphodiesterase n=1 Tax=Aromatoleum aromaticum (strain DSM 19018 / LMG 30748 / EbN1) TaxID=76114 RepID=Q5P1Y2_AROAE|nr:glycerophosphodiester phosphodiesterase [Aromatoleum aromaticum]NMG56740.1 glycerophosphodiester phosphodiesterase [Aromatoleum aromaticum]CAI08682.1 Glycerophosphoryl diester phosphodiesterase [Aromatoleum aromaticum EbN1]
MTPPRSWPLARVLAHRCGGLLAPENTLAGLAAAAEAGCGGVEFDVMLSGSGSPVLIHDETLERTTDGHGHVALTRDENLRALDAGTWFDARFAGERVPTLEEAAARCISLGLSVNLEIKPAAGQDEETARVVACRADHLWAGAAVAPLLSSFSELALEVAAQLAPHLPRGLLVDRVPPDWLQRCRRVGAAALHADARYLDRPTVIEAREAGLWVATYTVNDPARAQTLFDWGVDCVITDWPGVVRPAVTQHRSSARYPAGSGAQSC